MPPADLVCEVNGLLDEKLLELERHLLLQKKRVESRAVDRVEKRKAIGSRRPTPRENLSAVNALLIYFLFSTLYFWPEAKNRGDRIRTYDPLLPKQMR